MLVLQFSSQGLSWEGDVYPLEEEFEQIVAEKDTLLIKRTVLTKKYLFKADEQFAWNVDVCIKVPQFNYNSRDLNDRKMLFTTLCLYLYQKGQMS